MIIDNPCGLHIHKVYSTLSKRSQYFETMKCTLKAFPFAISFFREINTKMHEREFSCKKTYAASLRIHKSVALIESEWKHEDITTTEELGQSACHIRINMICHTHSITFMHSYKKRTSITLCVWKWKTIGRPIYLPWKKPRHWKAYSKKVLKVLFDTFS